MKSMKKKIWDDVKMRSGAGKSRINLVTMTEIADMSETMSNVIRPLIGFFPRNAFTSDVILALIKAGHLR